MWIKPWGFKEGIAIGCGLFATGMLLQVTLGRIIWGAFAAPLNGIFLVVFLLLLVVLHQLRSRVYLCRWLSTPSAAVSALLWATAMTVVMGLVRQQGMQPVTTTFPGFEQMLSQWSFVLIYSWLTLVLGLTILRAGFPLQWSRIPFWLSHAGLFVVLICATLGNADLQRLKMTTQVGRAEWRATDDAGQLHELALAVELQEFSIDEYPPKLMLIDNATGGVLPADKPEHILLESGVQKGQLPNWEISIETVLLSAATVSTVDTLRFVEFHSLGATTAAFVTARRTTDGVVRQGWVSCGSLLFSYKALRLDEAVSLVMPDREPQRFASVVKIYSADGQTRCDTIEVNRPLQVGGWKIYQLSYDETKGRWSDVSLFELVHDPWLPYVYIGIGMLILGAVCQFVQSKKRKETMR